MSSCIMAMYLRNSAMVFSSVLSTPAAQRLDDVFLLLREGLLVGLFEVLIVGIDALEFLLPRP